MSKQLRVTIPNELHPWLENMAKSTEIQDYSKLVGYLLQRIKDEAVFVGVATGTVGNAIMPMSRQTLKTSTDIEIEADW